MHIRKPRCIDSAHGCIHFVCDLFNRFLRTAVGYCGAICYKGNTDRINGIGHCGFINFCSAYPKRFLQKVGRTTCAR